MTLYHKAFFSVVICSALLLGACSPKKPWLMEQSTHTPHKMALVEDRHVVKKPLSEFDARDTQDAVALYNKAGAGPVYIVVAHDDKGKGIDSTSRAKIASITSAFLQSGVSKDIIQTSIVPLNAQTPITLVAFNTLRADGPQDCTDMPGFNGLPAEESAFDYKLGCGVKDIMARQIANPRDLEGRAGLSVGADGDRVANIIYGDYRVGEPNEFLPTYVISELAGQ